MTVKLSTLKGGDLAGKENIIFHCAPWPRLERWGLRGACWL